jgi:hypothetical protein
MTMAEAQRGETKGFSSTLDLPPDALDYRPVCGTAIAGMLLGLASFAGFFGEALWSLGFLAMLVSLWALYRIGSTTPPLMGKTPALIGLGLSLVFTAGAMTRHFALEWITQSESRQVMEMWIGALAEGDLPLAHQLSKDALARDTRLDELDKVYAANHVLNDEKDLYARSEHIAKFVQAAPSGGVRLEGVEGMIAEDAFDQVAWRVSVQGEGGEQRFIVATRRLVRHRQSPGGWRIFSVVPATN